MNSPYFLLQNKSQILQVDCVVNCLGFELNAHKYPLLKQMMQENLLTQDKLMCKSLDPAIHLLGGLNLGKYFESTAVPELRKQVEELFLVGMKNGRVFFDKKHCNKSQK